MRVVEAGSYGGPEVLALVERAAPCPGEGEVLIRVEAAGTNPVDAECRAGAAAGWFDEGPYVWGWDVAGVVAGRGQGATRFVEGAAVYGMPGFPSQARAYAEYLVCNENEIAAAPRTIDAARAASLPLAGLTALQIVDRSDVRPQHRVLVNGAAGGVGQLAVQLAAERAAHVIAVARAATAEFVRDRGAAEVLDRHQVDVVATVREVDVVIDCVGVDALLDCVRDSGIIAPVPGAARGAGLLEERAGGRVRVLRHVVAPDGIGLGRLATLVDTGRLRPDVAEVRPLAEVRTVHAELDAGRSRGKIVLSTGRR